MPGRRVESPLKRHLWLLDEIHSGIDFQYAALHC
jgi:hypothetical protein